MLAFLIALFTLTNEIRIEPPKQIIQAEITMYNAHPDQTDDDPLITASGEKVDKLTAACPNYLEFGQVIKVDGKTYICRDRMNKRYRDGHYFDLIADTREEALEFGRKVVNVEIY